MKKNKIQRQLNAYYRIKAKLDKPDSINLNDTKKGRKGDLPSLKEVYTRLQKELDILEEKLRVAGYNV